ncbi:prepilin-type N-terminal cleavage/methylation domain-containing protein [Alkalibacter rhizosphaerae]|uniref:Prepilin-type N-terminal cleavage/methylation domain-containing protein n=1 Tax=Alkalibacter rhizosphaerae TaxID=2815577 RepID=A0A974XF06_9FIRM|nr:prepilin-type N-terminal cleavage/methylation domain-containing protein [Alkalibacter rhizosphaerae]QSX08652.1 prepilin-type N-terminal cleavage/methylation domain-containing protein [Alkalibacter rhizosphaerae]
MIKRIKNKDAMTLIEVVIAVAVFAIMAILFISLFTSSILWIFGAGDRGEAYSNAQGDIETRLGTKDAGASQDLVIDFGGTDVTIEGGLVESEQTVGDKDSKLVTFLPKVPTISIDPTSKSEGYQNRTIVVNGENTNFTSGSTTVELLDKFGSIVLATINTPTVSSDTSLNFTLPNTVDPSYSWNYYYDHLLSNEFIVRVRTPISGKPDQLARAKFRVDQPDFLAIGNTSVFVTELEGTITDITWMDRSSKIGLNGLVTSVINASASNGTSYAVVGDDGLFLLSHDLEPWTRTSVSAEDLLGVAWSSQYEKFYVVGRDGRIYSSSDGSFWSNNYDPGTPDTGMSYALHDIVSTDFAGTYVLNAVGDSGRLLYSSNGSTWNEAVTNISDDLRAITSGAYSGSNLLIGVGDNGRIVSSSDGSTWTTGTIASVGNINDVIYFNGSFIAVGDNGLILTSVDGGSNWSIQYVGTNSLRSIHARGTNYIIVGDSGTVLYSNNGTSWIPTTGLGVDLKSVVGR